MWGRIVGSDVEVRQLTSKFGAVSRETVVKYDDAIYFMTTLGEIMVLDGSGIRNISELVQNRLDTMFVDYIDMQRHANLVGVDDAIKLVHDSTELVLSMDIPSQTWGHEIFRDFAPTRMFVYDSTRGSGDVSEVLFEDGTDYFRRQYRNGSRGDQSGSFAWAAEFSIPGDGLNAYDVRRLNFRMEPRSSWKLRYTIYDGDGDSLVSDSIYQTSSAFYANNRFLRWSVKPHDAIMFPFVRLWGAIDPNTGGEPPVIYNNLFDIETIIFTVTKGVEFETQ